MALTRASAAVVKTEELIGFRNKIINGDMRIDQRNVGASVNLTSTQTYIVDRWSAAEDTDGTMTAQQSTVAPDGFTNSFLLTTGTEDTSLSASQFASIRQIIEGYNIADLGWGTANAQPVTLSFWVRSSLTGNFGGSLRQGTARSYVFSYTISSANTWEYKTITIVGDTSGTWNTTNGAGITLTFALASGSTFQGTTGAWNSNNNVTFAGAVSVIGTAGATFYITGVQLEAGSVATPFERRPYGTELALCHRYYYRQTPSGTAYYGSGFCDTTTISGIFVPFPVPMRTAVNAVEQSGTATHYRIQIPGNVLTCSSVPVFNFGDNWGAVVLFTVSSGLTIGQGCLGRSNSTSGYLGFNAEL